MDTLLSDEIKQLISTSIEKQRFFEISIDLNDSTIVNAIVRHRPNDMSKELCQQIEKSLIGHKPSYSFIDRYQYGSYSFVLDKHRLKD